MRHVRRSNKSFREMVKQKMRKFLLSDDEYLEFPDYILKLQEDVIVNVATSMNLFVRQCTEYHKCGIRVYKTQGESSSESFEISISEKSAKLLYSFLKKDFILYNSRYYDICKPSGYKFSIGFSGRTATVPKPKPITKGDLQPDLPIFHRKEEIFKCLQSHNVLIILGEAGSGKSTQVPIFLLESSASKNCSCKILSLQTTKLATVLCNEILAENVGGHNVGYHIHLEGKSSALTCLMFTTYTFFLRWLVSLENYEVFRTITHVIIDGVHQRKANLNLILKEMRDVITFFSNVKLILLGCPMDATPLTEYFPQAAVINVDYNWLNPELVFLEDVLCFVDYVTPKGNGCVQEFSNDARNIIFDQLLEKCFTSGDFESFDFLLHAIEYKNVPVDVQHTVLKITPLIASTCHNNVEVLAKLLKLKANIFITDKDNKSALSWAVELQHSKCKELLEQTEKKIVEFKTKYPEKFEILSSYEAKRIGHDLLLDHELLCNVVFHVHTHFEIGTVVVFMPDFSSILQQKKIILENLHNVIVLVLHDETNCSDIKRINQHRSENIRLIVLTTDVAETTVNIQNVICVIDTGVKSCMSYSLEVDNFAYRIRSITKEESFRRSLVARRSNSRKRTFCIRLYSSFDYEEFDDTVAPETHFIPLEKFCLFAALLTRGGNLYSYLESIFENISSEAVQKCVSSLRCIGAVDRLNIVTPLGIRLIDIPVDIYLGKALIYAVVLRCLDPVVTIVSALAYRDPWVNPINYCHQKEIEESRTKFSESLYSDHLGLLRVFQQWQNEQSVNSSVKFCEENFLLDSTLQTISNIRVLLISSLRVSNLIHSNGIFCMKSINQNSHNWPLVKCALAAGSYPHICYIDKINNVIRGVDGRQCILTQNSVLKPKNRTFREINQEFPSNWLFSYGVYSYGNVCSLNYSSILSPVGVILCTGNNEMSRREQVCIKGEESQFSWTEWASFTMSKRDALVLTETKYRLSKFVMFALDCSNNPEVFCTKRHMFEKLDLINVLANIIEYEEYALNLRMPHKIGEKPKALPGKNASEQQSDAKGAVDVTKLCYQSKCCYVLSKLFYNNVSLEMTWPRSSLQLIDDYVETGYNVIVFGYYDGFLNIIRKFNKDRAEVFEKLFNINTPLYDLRSCFPGLQLNDSSEWQWLPENVASMAMNKLLSAHASKSSTLEN